MNNNLQSFTNQELIEELNRRIDNKMINPIALINVLKEKTDHDK